MAASSVGEAPLVPPVLAQKIRDYPAVGDGWLDELPALVQRCVARWNLTLLPAFSPGGESSWTAPVHLPDGGAAVRAWDGNGAVRLFAHEPSMRATLMERCVPRTDAMDLSADEADAVAASVLPQHVPSAGLPEP